MGLALDNFRSSLFLDEQRFLFDVWKMAANGELMPNRKTFSPCGFGPLLPFISLIEINKSEKLRIRVIGSGLKSVFCSDPKEILMQHELAGSIDTIEKVIEVGQPVSGKVEITSNARSGQQRHWLRLPLGKNGKVDSVIGLDLCVKGNRVPLWAMQYAKRA